MAARIRVALMRHHVRLGICYMVLVSRIVEIYAQYVQFRTLGSAGFWFNQLDPSKVLPD